MSFRPVNDVPSQAVGDDNNASASDLGRLVSHDTTSSRGVAASTSSYTLQKQKSPNSESQVTVMSSISNESNRVFTPPMVEVSASNGAVGSGQGSSQESQLLQLSQLAAAREKMPDVGPRSSVKRTADGAVKDSRTPPAYSPPRPSSHSRNVSGVSVASTASSRATELSSELKARLSYAMLKLNNGWQSRTIDEVENLASTAGSPASSNSTIPGHRSSSSPQIQTIHRPITQNSSSTVSPDKATDGAWRGPSTSPRMPSASARAGTRLQDVPSLAPPVSIQPERGEANVRRNSNPKYTPTFLTPRSHHDTPQTPAVPSLHITPDNRALRAAADPMVISPTHNNREKDAMEALLFMSSPGNSANLKNHYPGSQPASGLRNGATSMPSPQRTALPTSAPKRKSLPNGRPTPSSQPLPTGHSPKKRVGFGRASSTFSDMDIDDPASPRRQAVPRLVAPPSSKTNGAGGMAAPHAKGLLPLAGGSGRPTAHKSELSYERLDDVLDRMATEDSSSDSDGEIELPVRRDQSSMRI